MQGIVELASLIFLFMLGAVLALPVCKLILKIHELRQEGVWRQPE